MPDQAILEARELAVRRGSTPVISGLDLRLCPDERLGVIASNGAGKSTLLRTIAGLHRLSGTLRVGGHSAGSAAAARVLGWMPDVPVHPKMSLRRLMRVSAALRGGPPADVAALGLDPKTRADRLSSGQARLVSFALATAHRPALLLLDEPFTALDRGHRQHMLTRLSEHEGAMILTAHHPDDLGGLTDRLLYLRAGRLHGSPT